MSLQAQTLPERNWTSTNGRKLSAELLKFDVLANQMSLRVKGGSIFKVDPQTLIREDQALVLRAYLKRAFRESPAVKDRAANFSPKRHSQSAFIVSIGVSRDGATWLKLKSATGLDTDLLEQGRAVIIDGASSGLVRLSYSAKDLSTRGSQSSIALSLTEHVSKLSRIFSDKKGMKLTIERGPKQYTPLPIAATDQNGMAKSLSIYKWLSELNQDHVWWSVYQDLDKQAIHQLKIDRGFIAPTLAAEPREQLSDTRDWNLRNESLSAQVVGFDRHRVILELEGQAKNTRKIPIETLSTDDRQFLAKVRMKRSLANSWHPYDDHYSWYWPRELVKQDSRTAQPALLFLIERTSGRPQLTLQLLMKTYTQAEIGACRLSSPALPVDLEFDIAKATKLRTTRSTIIWIPIDPEIAQLLMTATPVMDELEWTITPADDSQPEQRGKFDHIQFRDAIEAIEVHRLWNSLRTDQ